LEKRLKDEKMMRVYEKLDKPLVEVLQNMEALGVKVDVENLKNLSSEFAKKMADLENEIHKLAGRPFNLASPKQLGEILFDELSIPYSKSKTKSGEYRTDANYLEELAAQGYELPEKILVWRGLAKLKSTYSDALVSDINPNTGRIHTSFMQTVVLSGRLSSNNPNLQNIPIKNEDGRKIRQAFVADKGGKILSADYSQVELRIIAAVSKCSALLEAFKEGADIHKATASGIFGVNEDEVTSEMRRQAKVVNFSLIYGSTHWGLARNLGISKGEAKNYIDRYFARYPEILDFMEKQKQIGFEKGYVETLFGRKCYISGFTNPKMKASAERAAINAPIQGTAADVMRFAMIKMHDLIKTGKLDAKMIIQVHDELVFEVGEAKVDGVREVIKETMENAAPSLDIELPVEVGAGDNWDEAH
jgi:DNA polymerase-1